MGPAPCSDRTPAAFLQSPRSVTHHRGLRFLFPMCGHPLPVLPMSFPTWLYIFTCTKVWMLASQQSNMLGPSSQSDGIGRQVLKGIIRSWRSRRLPDTVRWHLDLILLSLQNCEKSISIVYKPPPSWFWKGWEYQNTWPASWEICMQVRKQQLKLDMEQQTGSK